MRDRDALAGGREVDLLVVGGGVSGTGVALDAATRGMTVALIEKADLAHGTSRWSSKLVHGGLRYLAKGDVAIAHESAVERGILMNRTAPHLVKALPMVTPVGPGMRKRQVPLTGTGLVLGDLLRLAARTPRSKLPAPRWIGPDEARSFAPAVDPKGLRGALLSFDGQLVDDARLVVALARTAAAHGATILTYCEARSLDGGGADVVDARSGEAFRIQARHVVNATGVWASELDGGVSLAPSKGSHLVFRSSRLGNPRAALLAAVPGTISRFVFLLPQTDGRVYLGLTDEPVDAVEDVPTVGDDEARFLLDTINPALADPLTEDDIVGRFAGLRPLVAGEAGSSADLSRRHQVVEREDGVLTLVGGKLTTYRRMASDTVDVLAKRADLGPSVTAETPLVGAPTGARRPTEVPMHLWNRYGTEGSAIVALERERPELKERIVAGLPYRRSELVWALLHEGALDVSDLLDRRTRIGLVPTDREEAAPVAASILAEFE